MLPPESAFCSNHDRKRTFLGCVHAYFAKAFWNADSKRRSKTPFTEVLFMLPSRRRRYVYRRRHVSEFSECLIQAIVRAQVNRKGVYMTSFKRGYNVILRSCFHQNQRFALTTFVNAHFWAFWIGVLKRVYSKISMDATAFCSNHVWKRWFWPQKLSINAPRFWIGVLKRVYSKISMDATAFCSNHVWKRWFWPQKLSINALFAFILLVLLILYLRHIYIFRSQITICMIHISSMQFPVFTYGMALYIQTTVYRQNTDIEKNLCICERAERASLENFRIFTI